VKLRSQQPSICPDCGQYPATLHDGSGWFCEACKAYVDKITAIIEDNIRRQNMDECDAKENGRKRWNAWYSRNKVARANDQRRRRLERKSCFA
jgi:ribosomal protein L37AE/L43A